MSRRNIIPRLFLSGTFACLLAASIQAKPAWADDSIETPTAAEILETTPPLEGSQATPTGEHTSTPSATDTETQAPSSETATLTQTITPTITAAPVLPGKYSPNEVLVRFKNSATDEMITACLNQINGSIDSLIEEISVSVVRFDSVSVSNVVATISMCEGVRYVEPNYLAFSTDTIPNDTGWSNQYGLVNIRAPQGWDVSRGSSNVVIAILDTGVDLSHPDLAAKVVAGYDFVNDDPVAQDDNGHGTHVAGIAAAVSNNGSGIAGVSWGARIMPVKVLNSAGGGTFADVAAGITWAADHSAHIINLSVGGSSSSLVLQNAVDYAANHGLLIIAASGNTGSNFVLYPAAYPNVIAVGATNSSNILAGFSNYGPEMDLVAPGVWIYSTTPGGTYGYRDGTSMATPFVAGLAAILRGLGNSAGTARLIMENTALDLGGAGWDMFYGSGLIQMDSAILLGYPSNPAMPIGNTPPVFPLGGYLPTATYTPSVTITSTSSIPTSEIQTATMSFQPEETLPGINTPTPEVIALETQSPVENQPGTDWFIPCCGVLFVLLGIFLFWYVAQRKRHHHTGQYL